MDINIFNTKLECIVNFDAIDIDISQKEEFIYFIERLFIKISNTNKGKLLLDKKYVNININYLNKTSFIVIYEFLDKNLYNAKKISNFDVYFSYFMLNTIIFDRILINYDLYKLKNKSNENIDFIMKKNFNQKNINNYILNADNICILIKDFKEIFLLLRENYDEFQNVNIGSDLYFNNKVEKFILKIYTDSIKTDSDLRFINKLVNVYNLYYSNLNSEKYELVLENEALKDMILFFENDEIISNIVL